MFEQNESEVEWKLIFVLKVKEDFLLICLVEEDDNSQVHFSEESLQTHRDLSEI